MGKAAQIISSTTGVARRKAELAEHQLRAAGLLVVEEEAKEEVKEVQEVKAQKVEKEKGGDKQ